jgi:hypothetical protein
MSQEKTMKEEIQKDTTAWIFQTWASFVLAFGTMLVGIYYLPVDPWIRGFMVMGTIFTVASSFTLAKTIRDNHEASKLINRVRDAKAEKILREYEFSDAA